MMAQKPCTEEGCETPGKTRGMCNKHYLRWWVATQNTDRPPPDPTITASYEPLPDKLLRRTERQPSGCLHWTGRINDHGYGEVSISRRPVPAHLAMYRVFVGPVPTGMQLDHLCHTRDESCPGGDTCPHRRCCELTHLEPVTARENTLRSRSFTARNAVKTHCEKRGHLLSGDNLVINAKGQRSCKACTRISQAEWREKNKVKLRDDMRAKRAAAKAATA